MKKVSIITPVYNGEKYIKRCIESVLNQTYENIEHFVINDGSKDNTKKICEQFEDEKLKVINIENGGVSNARNLALKQITGDYVMFLDADDWIEKDAIELMVNKIEEDDNDLVVCSFNNYYERNDEFEQIKLFDKHQKLLSNILDESTNFGGYPWNKLIKRNVIKTLYNTDVHYYENLLFFVENVNDNMKYGIIDKSLYNYCINDNSALHSKKYSIKKASQLDALQLVIKKVPKQFCVHYKYLFIANYFENLFYIKENQLNVDRVLKFKKELELYYKDIRFSRNLSNKKKLKIFVLYRLNFIYSFVKKLKK